MFSLLKPKSFQGLIIVPIVFLIFSCGCRKGERNVSAQRPVSGMVEVAAGRFVTGCGEKQFCEEDEGGPGGAVEVSLGAFHIGRNEVTNGDYGKCVDAGACEDNAAGVCLTRYDDGRTVPVNAGDLKGDFHAPGHPAVCVSWVMADAFCKWAGGRLPSDAEWEKAARGDDGRIFPWGNSPATGTANLGRRICCGADDSDGFMYSAPAGSFPAGASPYGALDMAGNVWEWTSDCAAADEPEEDCPARNARGGSWRWTLHEARAANRYPLPPQTRADDVGFRCAE